MPAFSLDGTQNKGFEHNQAQLNQQRYDDLELVNYLDQDSSRSNRLAKIFGLNKRVKYRNENFLFNSTQDLSDNSENGDSGNSDDNDGNDKLSNYFLNGTNCKFFLFKFEKKWHVI